MMSVPYELLDEDDDEDDDDDDTSDDEDDGVGAGTHGVS